MFRSSLRSFVFTLATTALVATAARAQDVVTVGSVQATGASVSVPIYIQDNAGTPLGRDAAAGSRIQSLSIKVSFPASAIASASIDVSGITDSLASTFKLQPADAQSASLLVTFQEATNLIPFTLNAGAPGNEVARLTLTLKQPVAPGSTIPLDLDASLTQLTDDGGNAATKESAGNGRLALVDGSVRTPALTMSISPQSATVAPGASTPLSVQLSSAVASQTTVSLSSSDPAVATVASSVTIAAGNSFALFEVTGLKPGNVEINASIAGGPSANAVVIVAIPPPVCTVPAAPLVSAPAAVSGGQSYTVTWLDVAGATSYTIEEATNASFTGATSKTVNVPAASYVHPATPVSRYYYRVRARAQGSGCDTTSSLSNVVSVELTEAPTETVRTIPVAGSTPGAFGSYFKTAVQLHNPTSGAISGRFVFHPAGTSGTPTDPVLAFNLAAGKSAYFADLLPAMGVATGIGSVDLVANAGSAMPVASIRVFSDAGVAGTTGFAMEAVRSEDYLRAGNDAVLLAPAEVSRFRLNIGVRTFEQGASFTITVRDSEGVVKATVQKSFAATFFTQASSAAFLDGFILAGGDSIRLHVDAGNAVVYGSTTDNVTNDPSAQLARRVD